MIVDIEVNIVYSTYLSCNVVRGGSGSVPGRKVHKLYNKNLHVHVCLRLWAESCHL